MFTNITSILHKCLVPVGILIVVICCTLFCKNKVHKNIEALHR